MVNVRLIFLAYVTITLFGYISDAVKVRSLPKHCVDSGFAGACTSSTGQTRQVCTATLACAVLVNGTYFKQANGRVPENTPCGSLKACQASKCVAVAAAPTVVGSTTGVRCGGLVPTAHKIVPRVPPPLSP